MNTGINTVDTNRRLGRFTISEKLLRESISNGLAGRVFYGAVPLDVTRNWLDETSTFLLWHPKFDNIPEGSMIPEYIAVVENGAITWERVEVNAGTAAPLTMEKFDQMVKGGAA